MRIAFLVQHSVNDNHRTRRLLRICERLGNTSFVSFESPERYSSCSFYRIKNRILIYFYMRKHLKTIKPDIVLIHDHICAPLIPFIIKVIKPKCLIYDMSELYLRVSPSASFLGNIVMSYFLHCAKKNVKKADIVITANEDRATITKGYYMCLQTPLVFENIHKISTQYNLEECDKKFEKYFRGDKIFTAVFAGGVSEKRMTGKVIDAFSKMGSGYQLLILGKRDKEYYSKLENKYGIFDDENTIHYLGFVSQEELKYLYERSKINIITYEQTSLNNIYCASGRLFESLFCGIPFVSSDNPPLVKMADKYKVGVATGDDFEFAIKTIQDNYDFYRENVANAVREIDPVISENNLYSALKDLIDQCD